MKKLLSLLVLTAMLLASFAFAATATGSPVGAITKVTEANPVFTDGTGAVVTPTVTDVLTDLEADNNAAYLPTNIGTALGAAYANHKNFGGFAHSLTEYGKTVVGSGTLVVDVTINVPGVTAANSPAVYYYNAAANTYTVLSSTVDGSTVTFKTMPLTGATTAAAGELSVSLLSATDAASVGYYGVVYTGAVTSPSTGVQTTLFIVVLAVALAGAAFAGKKVFAK